MKNKFTPGPWIADNSRFKTCINTKDKYISGHLRRAERRYGDTWKRRPRKGQRWRAFKTILRFFITNDPELFLKLAGEGMIGWLRESYHWRE